jgi:hypothetical protein
VNVFRSGDGFVVALTYGRSDWVRNVLASGGCEIEHRGRRYRATAPRLIGRADAARSIPAVIRFVLALLRVEEFVRLELASS